MNWQLLPQFAITGFLNGGPIALIALGIVLVYKSSEIFNFAEGQMLLLGTLATWWFAADEGLGLPLWLAIICGLAAAAIIGLLIERLALRPLTGQPLLSIILMTLAMSQFLQGLAILIFGTTQRNFPVIFDITNPYKISLPFTFNDNNIIVILKQNLVWSFVIAMVCVVILWLFFQYTRTGLSMRAAAEDHETAQSVGIRINRVFALSWAMAGVIATIGGILIATASGLDLSFPIIVLAALPAVLLGGLDSIPGAVVGSLLIGTAQGLAALPNDSFIFGPETAQALRNSAAIVPYVILLIVLLIRPDGLFGRKRIERV